jgi:hypothetical protein
LDEPVFELILVFRESRMFGNLLAPAAPRRIVLLLAGLVVALAFGSRADAAHLRVPVLYTPIEQAEFNKFLADRPVPTTEEERKKLFQEFEAWCKARQSH